MSYPIIDFKNNDFKSFIEQWSSLYNYDKMHLYDSNIIKSVFEEKDLKDFYKWKNGSDLSEKKGSSLEKKILSKLHLINKFKQDFNNKSNKNDTIDKFSIEFKDVSFVWKIFLLHIISPNNYPIYDQHVHRAYLFLNRDESFKNIENTISEKEKCKFYFNIYLPFINRKIEENNEFKIQDIDKAFFSFGQFLKKYKIQLEK